MDLHSKMTTYITSAMTSPVTKTAKTPKWFRLKPWVFPFTFQAYILPHTLNCMCFSLFKFHI